MDGAPEGFDARSRATRHELETRGELTVVTVVAVSPNGKIAVPNRISSPSAPETRDIGISQTTS